MSAVAEAAAQAASTGGPPRTAAAAVEAIRACRDALRVLWDAMESRVMESCWVIRREIPDREAFTAYVRERLDGVMEADRAWAAAAAWDAARSNRDLRRLASRRPAEAVDYMYEFVKAGREDLAGGDVGDEAQRRAVEILSAPAAKRTRMVRRLIESERTGRSPEDAALIEAQEAEIAGLRAERERSGPEGRAALRECLETLGRIDGELAEVGGRLAETARLADGGLRMRLQAAADGLYGRCEAISDLLMDSGAEE
ncbi:MAG: hypothetical protein F4Y03_00495 [Alphaproteobacteria bacterium]|nr:hypothetical protein [Alphaproteobacteria bacterium]